MSFEKLIEGQIQDAIERGDLSGLPGEGEPLPIGPLEYMAGTNWMGFHVLQRGGLLPEWLELAREIERDEEKLASIRRGFLELVTISQESGAWDANAHRLRSFIDEFSQLGRRLRTKQDQFNVTAQGDGLGRPGIWVDEKIRQLATAMRDHGAPESAIERSCA